MALQRTKRWAKKGTRLTEGAVQEIHRLIFAEAWPDQAGRYRGVEIDAFEPIADQPPPPSAVREEMLVFGRQLADRTAPSKIDPLEAVRLAIWSHMELVRIHPFQEGNGKTARFVMSTIVMRYVTGHRRPLVIPDTERERYLDCVQQARQGRVQAFEGFLADLLERLAEEDQAAQPRRLRWMRRRTG